MAKKKEIEKKDLVTHEKQDFVIEQMKAEIAAFKDKDGKAVPGEYAHVLRAICQMSAFNLSPQRIANNCGMPTERVKRVLMAPSVQREISRLQTELYSVDTAKMFKRMVPEAANTVFGLMGHGDKDSVRVEAAKVILDRALGKPTQTIEQTTTLIKEVFSQLNGLKSDKAQATDAEIVPMTPSIDSIEDRLPEGNLDPLEAILAEVDKPKETSETQNQEKL